MKPEFVLSGVQIGRTLHCQGPHSSSLSGHSSRLTGQMWNGNEPCSTIDTVTIAINLYSYNCNQSLDACYLNHDKEKAFRKGFPLQVALRAPCLLEHLRCFHLCSHHLDLLSVHLWGICITAWHSVCMASTQPHCNHSGATPPPPSLHNSTQCDASHA